MMNDRGAITIHVAIAMAALLAFAGAVVDHGVFLVARGQAQNAADAGALAGALSLLEDSDNKDQAVAAAKAFAGVNRVWGERTQPWDVVIPTGISGLDCPAPIGWERDCIRVEVLRGLPDSDRGTHQNPIPTFMVRMIDRTLEFQGTRAVAVGQVTAGNTAYCLKPWAIFDKWDKPGWTQADVFHPGDAYTPLGFKTTENAGAPYAPIVLRDTTALAVDFGAAAPVDDVLGCDLGRTAASLYASGGPVPCTVPSDTPDPARGCLQVSPIGITSAGIDEILNRDSGATIVVTPAGPKIVGSCISSATPCTNPNQANVSPRLLPVAVINTGEYFAHCGGGPCVAQVVNIVGLFVEGTCLSVWPDAALRPHYCGTPAEAADSVVGHLTTYPGANVAPDRGVAVQDTFVRYTRLIR